MQRSTMLLLLLLLPALVHAAAVTLSWDAYPAPQATGLRLERSSDEGRTWETVVTVPSTTTQTTDTTVQPGQRYRYRLIAVGTSPTPPSEPSNPVDVTCCAGPTTLSATPPTVQAGTSATVTWAGISAPAASNFVTLALPNTGDNSYVRYQRTNGQAAGSMAFAVPVETPAGTYEFRLYPDDTYTRLATSPPVQVTVTGGLSPSPRR
jgi:hypothetical protein